MTKEEILEYFKDINFMYNESGRLDSLSHMLDELLEEAQTEPTGHWIEHYNPEAEICMQHMSECSVCGKMICGRYNIYKNFCPNCGEKMEEEQKTT